jgi:hypothetical protein
MVNVGIEQTTHTQVQPFNIGLANGPQFFNRGGRLGRPSLLPYHLVQRLDLRNLLLAQPAVDAVFQRMVQQQRL